jgi:hypothetical protein
MAKRKVSSDEEDQLANDSSESSVAKSKSRPKTRIKREVLYHEFRVLIISLMSLTRPYTGKGSCEG